MEQTIKFTDKATCSYIDMAWNDNVCWINYHYIDDRHLKLFMILMKTSFKEMKKKGCTKYQQLSLKTDWDLFLKENPEWKIIKENKYDESVLIECNIDIASELVIDSFLRNNNNC